MRPASVLCVEADGVRRCALGSTLRSLRQPCHLVAGFREAEEVIARRPSIGVVVADFASEDGGLALLARLSEERPDVVRVLLSSSRRERRAAAVNSGAVFRSLGAPWDAAQLLEALQASLAQHALVAENRRLTQEVVRLERLLHARIPSTTAATQRLVAGPPAAACRRRLARESEGRVKADQRIAGAGR